MASEKAAAELYAEHAPAIRTALGLTGIAVCPVGGTMLCYDGYHWTLNDGDHARTIVPGPVLAPALDSALAQVWWEQEKVVVKNLWRKGTIIQWAVCRQHPDADGMFQYLGGDGVWRVGAPDYFPSAAAAHCAVASVLAKMDAAKPAEPAPCPRCAELRSLLDTSHRGTDGLRANLASMTDKYESMLHAASTAEQRVEQLNKQLASALACAERAKVAVVAELTGRRVPLPRCQLITSGGQCVLDDGHECKHEPPKTTPVNKTGTWWVSVALPEKTYEVTGVAGRDCAARVYLNGVLVDPGYVMLGEWFDNGAVLRVPPRPTLPEGKRLTGRVIVPKKGERACWLNGEPMVVGDNSFVTSKGVDFGGRRWEWEDEPVVTPAPLTGVAWLNDALATGTLKAGDVMDYKGERCVVTTNVYSGDSDIRPVHRPTYYGWRDEDGWHDLASCFPSGHDDLGSPATTKLHRLPAVGEEGKGK